MSKGSTKRVAPHRPSTSGGRRRGGLLTLALLVTVIIGCASESKAPRNLIFVSLDTTRQDHLSAYGYERDTSPRLDALAARSVLFENGVAQMTITNPSHASMFTGLYPKTHHVGENTRELGDEFLTVTEILAAVGFRTGGFVSGHPLKPAITGIDQGFETYDGEVKQRRDGAETTDLAIEWLQSIPEAERFFLFVHYYDAHGPYRLKEEYEALFQSGTRGRRLKVVPHYQRIVDAEGRPLRRTNDFLDRYDRMIRFQDDLLGRILDSVDLEQTAIVVVADHGETLFDRQRQYELNHGTAVFDEQILIPFLIYSPELEATRQPYVVETVDLLPTMLDLLGLGLPPGLALDGESLYPVATDRAEHLESEMAFSSNRVRLGGYSHRGWDLVDQGFVHSVRTRRWKLILYPGVGQDHVELFNIQDDPGEKTDVGDRHPEQRDKLLQALLEWRTSEPAVDGEETVAPEDLEDLRALGYVG